MKSIPNLYTFRHNSAHTRGFAWASSIVPRSEMINRVCTDCGLVDNYPSGAFDVIIERGVKYPDVLGCGAYPFLIVSAVVVSAWLEVGIDSFHTHPVGIHKVQSERLKSTDAPLYFRIEIDGRCEIDLIASGIKFIRICKTCQRVIEQPMLAAERRYIMVESSWDGSAVFRDFLRYPRVSFCNQAVVDIASKYRFTNFRFDLMAAQRS